MTHIMVSRIIDRYKGFLRKSGKIIYYIFICWMTIVSIVGVYKVFSDRDLKEDNVELQAVLDDLRKSEMYDIELTQLNQTFGNRYTVTLYFTTDTGPYDTGEVTILARSGANSESIKRYWQSELAYQGYNNLNKRVIKEGTVYIPDIRKDTEIFVGDTKRDIINSNTKAVYAQLIEVDSLKNAYILSLSSKDSIEVETASFYFSTRQTIKNIREIINN